MRTQPSSTVAASYYGTSRQIYGYIYGGSGGSYQTFDAIENSSGVWDGAVPFIPGLPISIPNNFFARPPRASYWRTRHRRLRMR